MADTKITALAAIGANPINVATFPIPMVDLLDNSMAASGTTKKVTVNQILGAGGTATLASATITGDLTVNTNVLKVDTTNDRVGIGTASPSSILHISNTAAATRITITDDTTNGRAGYIESNYSDALVIGTTSGVRAIRFSPDNKVCHLIEPSGTFTWYDGLGGTRMTLNSTGLGVGVAPTASKLQIGLSAVAAVPAAGATGHNFAFGSTQYGLAGGALTSGNSYIQATRWDGTATNYDLLIQPNGGNVGIGVTPSYLLHTAVASGANRNIARFQVTGASNGLTITWNHATTKMIVNFSDLPTSSAGLASGDLWIDTSAGNTLKVA